MKVARLTWFLWPKTATGLPDSRFQTIAVWSLLAVATSSPESLNEAEATSAVCASSTACSSEPSLTFQTRAVLS